MNDVEISSWVDINSQEAKDIDNYSSVKILIEKCIKYEIAKPNKLGQLFYTKNNLPVYATLNSKFVGIKYSRLVAN